jgi:hypothetical protein
MCVLAMWRRRFMEHCPLYFNLKGRMEGEKERISRIIYAEETSRNGRKDRKGKGKRVNSPANSSLTGWRAVFQSGCFVSFASLADFA